MSVKNHKEDREMKSLRMFRNKGTLAITVGVVLIGSIGVWNLSDANHPVLVEGNNCADLGPNVTIVPPGTCGDFDGDGRIGTAEDTDNSTDRIFGTITAALAAANGGANQNGRVTIVTSGRFPEVVNITAANGNVTLEAVPGVEANIDAVLAGDAGNAGRQAAPGIIVNAPENRRVVIRNIVSRNWTDGILVVGQSHVTIDKCRLEGNRDYGIRVMDAAKVAITNCHVNGTGFRAAPNVNNTPDPGIGIEFEGNSSGAVSSTVVTGSFAAGIAADRSNQRNVRLSDVTVFGNNPDLVGVSAPRPF
ncbi:MAG: right-handed parallel beta-helix repeat-containing protein [Deltaproteobacteria bacterium]|nr:right-handed parallel beta-helix repeat-containing protein [Deltaproteobacteria bacterium]